VVPGYGMAVAQAQHAVADLAKLLNKRGIDVKYAIIPSPPHAGPHERLLASERPLRSALRDGADQSVLSAGDIVLVVGANDVTNPPHAQQVEPALWDADPRSGSREIHRRAQAQHAARIRGVDNELYYDPKCMMLFGDARDSLNKLFAALKT